MKKKKYRIGANITISLHCVVEATSKKEALRIAEEDMPLPSLCHQCAGGDETEEWCTSGEFDGTPEIIDVEED